jgi:hypothetical protein
MRFDKGWIKVWRMDDDHWLNKDILSKCLWYELLLMANYKTSKLITGGTLRELPPGTVVTSTYELADRLGLCRKSIDKRLNLFKNDLMISLLRTPLGTIITICNWNKYQGAGSDEVATEDTTEVATVVTTPVATVVAISEEDKKGKKVKNKNTVICDDPSLVLADIWNHNTSDKFPKVSKLNEKRLSAMKKAFKEHSIIEDWEKFASSLDKSKFHRGENERKWVADFEWFVRPGNILKFIEMGGK